MRGRTWFGLGLAVGLCLSITPFVVKQRDRRCNYDLVPVVVVDRDVPAGTELTLEMISQRSVPESMVTSTIVKPDSASHVIGQRLLIDLQAGDMLRWPDFGVDRLAVDQKVRAFTIALEPARMVSGQLSRGDRVDVLASMEDPQTKERVARTMLQNVVVLGVTGTEVTVAVLPEEAEVLMLTQELGRFALALRNRADPEVREYASRATINTLLSGERSQRWTGCRMQKTVEIIRSATP